MNVTPESSSLEFLIVGAFVAWVADSGILLMSLLAEDLSV